jgi:hypothetical protein
VDDVKLTISVMMPLFIDFCKKIEAVEKNLPKDVLPWEQKCVGESYHGGLASLCKCVSVRETTFMYVCVRLYFCICV